MDFKDELKQLAERVSKLRDSVNTEEATKHSFVIPFIKALGYDVFNPLEVVPEYVTDLGIKQGEKIDYAILNNSQPIILVECKWHGSKLDPHETQLFRYFHVSKASFGILTNGIEYRFYTDLVEPNKMDEKPFLTINLLDLKDNTFDELRKFHKSNFDIESILTAASELKYMSELTLLLQNEFNNPSPDFVRHFAKQVHSSIVTAKVLEQFTGLVKRVFNQHINDQINIRLKSALKKEEEKQELITNKLATENEPKSKINTTEEEIEAYHIVKAILRSKVKPERIGYKDAQSYFVVLLDDNVRRYVCRLYLESSKKYIGLFDSQKNEAKHELSSLDDIYSFSKQLLATVEFIDSPKGVEV